MNIKFRHLIITAVSLLLTITIFSSCNNEDSVSRILPASDSVIVECTVAGKLFIQMSAQRQRYLKITGSIDARDFFKLRNFPNLETLDLSEVTIAEYYGTVGGNNLIVKYPKNEIPSSAFTFLNDAQTGYIEYNLKNLILPESLSSIGRYSFSCNKLKSIIIPESVKIIREYAFHQCENLLSIEIPAAVDSINIHAFNTTLVNVDANNPNYSSKDGILFNKDKTNLVYYPTSLKSESYAIPPTVKIIDSYAFDNNIYLTSIIIPEGVTSIGIGAFSSCTGLVTIDIAKSVTSIGSYAFNARTYEDGKDNYGDLFNLKSVYVHWTTVAELPMNIAGYPVDASWWSVVFNFDNKNMTLYVPKGLKTDQMYQYVPWGYFELKEEY